MCTLASPQVVIDLPIDTELFQQDKTCLTEDCQYVFERDANGTWSLVDTNLDPAYRRIGILSKQSLFISKEHFEPFNSQVTNILYSEKFFGALDNIFIDDQSTLREPLYKEVAQWLFLLPASGIGANLHVSSFNSEVDTQALKSQHAFFSCSYTVVTANVGWMIERPEVRSYCKRDLGSGADCPAYALSHVAHMGYQIHNLSWAGLPYLLLYGGIILILLGAGGVLMYYIYVRKKSKKRKKKKRSLSAS